MFDREMKSPRLKGVDTKSHLEPAWWLLDHCEWLYHVVFDDRSDGGE